MKNTEKDTLVDCPDIEHIKHRLSIITSHEPRQEAAEHKSQHPVVINSAKPRRTFLTGDTFQEQEQELLLHNLSRKTTSF